jgi:hypothetical protein
MRSLPTAQALRLKSGDLGTSPLGSSRESVHQFDDRRKGMGMIGVTETQASLRSMCDCNMRFLRKRQAAIAQHLRIEK